jgi:hypothetical protein
VALNSNLGVTQAAEVFLSHVSARAIEAVCLLMVDSLDLETLMRVIPCRRFTACTTLPFAVRARMDEAVWLSELKTTRTEFPASLSNYHDNLTLAVLVPGGVVITGMCFDSVGSTKPA